MPKVVLCSRNDSASFNKSNICGEVLALSVDSFYILKQNIKFNKLKIIKQSDLGELTKKKNIVFLKKFCEQLDKNLLHSSLDITLKESIRILAPKTFSALLNILSLIKDDDSFLINIKNNWHTINNKPILIENIFKKNVHGAYNYKKNNNFKFRFLITIINYIIFFITKKKKTIWVTGTNNKLNEFVRKFQNQNKNYVIFKYAEYDNFYLLRILYSLYLTLNPFIKNKYLSIVPSLNFNHNNNNNYVKLLDIIRKSLPLDFESYDKIILNNIYQSLQFTKSLKDYTINLSIFKKTACVIAHHIRWLDGIALASSAKLNNINVFLISHNSHSITKDSFANFIQKNNAYGLIESHLATKTIVQSPTALNFMKKNFPHSALIKTKPIMWANYTIRRYEEIKTNTFNILYVDTIKNLSRIPYIYESSFDYINNLIRILKVIDCLKKIKFTIRFRASIDISIETMFDIFSKYQNVEINTKGSFLADIKKSNLLISHSSTTIEESLHERVPVALYGGKNKYYHLEGTEIPPTEHNRNAVYHINDNNIKKMILSIIKYHSNNLLTDKELFNYVWLDDSKNVRGLKEFNKLILE